MMSKALEEARQAIAKGEAGVGALLLWRDEILALDHNAFEATKDTTQHAEMVVLHQAAERLNQMSEAEKAELTIYSTLEPCLMCLSAISFAGIKRVVYSALSEDANGEQWVVKGLTADQVNDSLERGPMELIPGVKREEGRELLVLMGIESESVQKGQADAIA
ncbi:nucleoside deaminase [Leptolyngbya sp. FACHB-261]|nr:nucleoside deaminase [Leptolyngbya sp. FACHB-261]